MNKVCVKSVIVLAVLMVFGLAASTVWAGTKTTHYLTHDSVQRLYIKYIPSNLPTGDVPLVVVLHGGGQTAANIFDATSSTAEWTEVADDEGFVLVCPEGIDNAWNDCRSDDLVGSDEDDVGFIQAVIDEVDGDENIDLGHVFAGGSSNGGMMTMRLYFEISEEFAGFYTCIANLPANIDSDCGNGPAYEKPILMINGTSDTNYMPYSGGYIMGETDRGEVESATDTVDFFVSFLSCSTTPATRTYTNITTGDGGVIDRYDYSSCTDSTKVSWLKANGNGHLMPSIDHRVPFLTRLLLGLGLQNGDVEAAREIWEFWQDYI